MLSINLVIVSITLTILSRIEMSSATSTPAPYPCPDLDASSYADANGSSYNIQCSTDYPGNDLPAVHTDTFEECLKACDAYVPAFSGEAHDYSPCVGVSWGAGNSGASCYLKYSITTINLNHVGFCSGYYENYTLPNSGVTSPSSSHYTTSTPVISNIQAPTSTTSATQASTSISSTSISSTSISSATQASTPIPLTSTSISSTTQPTSRNGSGPVSHSGVGLGAGVGVGVGVGVVGLAILVGIIYLIRRQSRRRPEEPLELSAEQNHKKSSKLHKPSAEIGVDELPAENKRGELFDPRGPRAELPEIRGARAEMA